LLFVLREPGLLRIALDPVEVQACLKVDEKQYAAACLECRLTSTQIGRDYFDTAIKHHTFWDLLHFQLNQKLSIRRGQEEDALQDFLEQIATEADGFPHGASTIDNVIENAFSLARRLKAIDKAVPSIPRRIDGLTIGKFVTVELSKFGTYCRNRMRDEQAQIEVPLVS
jgi:hypothetical protein